MAATPEFFRTLLDNFHDGVYFVDTERRITYWNKSAERISGYAAGDVVGSFCFDEILMHVDAAGTRLCQHGCPLAVVLVDGEPHEAELFLHHKDGHRVPVQVRVAPVRDRDGRVTGAVETFTDNTAGMAALQRIEELRAAAYIDALTGVANRAFTEITLRAKLEELGRYGWPFGVLFLDIDGFKTVNDGHGHDVGDRVLATVARTLAGNARSFDLVGRWGGEEFLVVAVNVDEAKLRLLAERFRLLVAGSAAPTGGGDVAVTVSVGATLARPGDDPAAVVKRADAAMYESKRAGRNRTTFSL
ncbi:MAG: diguanylate cyclase [Acidobacteria bacterium]|nr:MAG: diguanylate cyclase [Acidobacteriota bacterium]